MIIAKIDEMEDGCSCVECKKNPAEIKVTLGTKKIAGRSLPGQGFVLCRDCAWNLAECLDMTTTVNFKECSR